MQFLISLILYGGEAAAVYAIPRVSDVEPVPNTGVRRVISEERWIGWSCPDIVAVHQRSLLVVTFSHRRQGPLPRQLQPRDIFVLQD